MSDITYKLYYQDCTKYDEVFDILQDTDRDFVPRLSAKFNLEVIARKYVDKSHLYIAYFNNEACGLVAFYPNVKPNDSYLSIIAVKKKYRGLKMGKSLELLCLNFCKENTSRGMLVNMRKSNKQLLKSRQELGYKIVKEYKLDYSDEIIADLYLDFG